MYPLLYAVALVICIIGAAFIIRAYCGGESSQSVEWRGAFSLLFSDETSQWINLDFEREGEQEYEIVIDEKKVVGIILQQVTDTTQPLVEVRCSDTTIPYTQQAGKSDNSRVLILYTPVSCENEPRVELEIRFARNTGKGKLVRFHLKTFSSWLADNHYQPEK